LGVFLSKRLHLGWRLFVIGATTFIASQVAHIPFNQFVLSPLIQRLGITGAKSGWPLLGIALLLGLSAGVFEEGARFLVLRYWARQARSWKDGLMFGAGHGGAEAIILGSLVAWTLAQMIAYRGADMSQFFPPSQVELATAQVAAYWSAPWYAALLGAVERAFAIVAQVCLATLVMQAFLRRNLAWLAAAVAWHTLLDMVAVFASNIVGAYATEALIGLMALASLGIVLWLRPKGLDGNAEPPPEGAVPALPQGYHSGGPPPTPERVEDTRFTA
jgi:uncharacterized membrane protein YhfC